MNIGLIGCGRVVERFYLDALSRSVKARLVAAADPIRERRELISRQIPSCKTFSSAEALLQGVNVSAVIIATPTASHIGMAVLAMRAGIPALVEKPLAPSLKGTKELEKLVALQGGGIMIGFNRRYWDPVLQLRRLMSKHSHSDSATAQLILETNPQAWSPISEISGPLDDLASHQFDLLRYVFGREIEAISARWTDARTIQMRIRLVGGVVADCLAAYSNVTRESITIHCQDQKYQIRMGSERVRPTGSGIRSVLDLYDALKRRLSRQRSSLYLSYEKQLTDFLDYISSGTAPRPSIADGIAAIRAVEAAQ